MVNHNIDVNDHYTCITPEITNFKTARAIQHHADLQGLRKQFIIIIIIYYDNNNNEYEVIIIIFLFMFMYYNYYL